MAVQPKSDPKPEAKAEEPEAPKPEAEGESVTDRLDRLEEMVRKALGGAGEKPKEEGQGSGPGGRMTRAEKEDDIAAKIRDEVKALRTAEKEEAGRSELLEKVKKLEEGLKHETPPESFSKLAKMFFPTGSGKPKAEKS